MTTNILFQRVMKTYHVAAIAIGGTVSSVYFLGSGYLLKEVGPFAFITFLFGGLISYITFAVISTGTRAIIFDSHKNEIIATNTKEGARAALHDKLAPFVQEMDDGSGRGPIDLNQFAYALTDFEQIPAPEAEPVVQANKSICSFSRALVAAAAVALVAFALPFLG